MLWIPLLTLIIAVPVVFWASKIQMSEVFSSSFFFMTLVGQLTGIVGVQLFSFSLLLSARPRIIEFFFGGLDRLYIIHHRVGVFAFVFLAIHPLILAFRFVQDSLEDAMWFLVPINNTLPRDFGIYALLLMLILIGLTFYGMIFSYPLLKNAHKFLGLAFFLGFFHTFFIPGALQMFIYDEMTHAVSMADDAFSVGFAVKMSCLTLMVFGFMAFIYRTLLDDFLVPRLKYVVTSVKMVGQDIAEIVLSPSTKKIMQHLPGQFAILSLTNAKGLSKEEHPFTISSANKNGELRFSIKALGDYSALLPSLGVGVKALLEGPFGEFTYSHGSTSQVWVAGGIGVTPFVSMAEDLLSQDVMDYTIDFFYSVRSEKDGAYKDVFTRLAEKHKGFTFHFMPSDTSGYVTGDGILKAIPGAITRDFFVCGPPPMMAALTGQLVGLKVPSSQIHSEKFALLK